MLTSRVTRLLLVLLTIGVWMLVVRPFLPALQGSARALASFDELTMRRLNVVERDGTKRLVLSSRDSFPGIVFRGKEYPHLSRAEAVGILFFNDEGTECGGLIFGGDKDKKGKVTNHGHLSFDRYEQDQVFSLDASDEEGKQSVSIDMQDRPEFSLAEVLGLSKDEQEKYYAHHAPGPHRVYLGRAEDGSVSLRLKDLAGHNRLLLEVAPDGAPRLQFLGEDGAVIYTLPPT